MILENKTEFCRLFFFSWNFAEMHEKLIKTILQKLQNCNNFKMEFPNSNAVIVKGGGVQSYLRVSQLISQKPCPCYSSGSNYSSLFGLIGEEDMKAQMCNTMKFSPYDFSKSSCDLQMSNLVRTTALSLIIIAFCIEAMSVWTCIFIDL